MIRGLAPDGLLHLDSPPDQYWSTTNVSEGTPGVVCPLGWSFWGPTLEAIFRKTFSRTGALELSQLAGGDDPANRWVSIFYGRVALNVNRLCEMGSRLPGTSSDAIAEQLLGAAPAELRLPRTLRRLPAIAVRMPYSMLTVRREVLRIVAPIKPWWTLSLAEVQQADLPGAQRLLDEARQQFRRAIDAQGAGFFIGVQPVYDLLTALIDSADLDPETTKALSAGQGAHAETEMIVDLWELSRDQLTLEEFLARHGYHGPLEGEVSSRVWREDPEPVRRLAAQYAARDEDEHPGRASERRMLHRRDAEHALLAKLPLAKRLLGRFVLKLAVQRIPLRGVAKAAFLQAIDIARASARRIGSLYVAQGVLDDPEDAFMFTADELLAGLPPEAKRIAAERRQLRRELSNYDIPNHWQGNPQPVPIDEAFSGDRSLVTGIGASDGVVEGLVRVVHDPAFTEVEPDEVLVCHITDPSWASIMFLSSALVTDIGGKLSHAAVVAREIGVPCVVGTGNGTKVLRTGDRVRVNGTTGTVEVLQPADAVSATPNDDTVDLPA